VQYEALLGCTYINSHHIKAPSGFKEAYDQCCEGGWQGLNFPLVYGGQGLPNSMGLFQSEVIGTACSAFGSYLGLSRGAIRTLITHASEEVKDIFVRRMVSGEWTGTMCLTEPHCGSDLNQVRTSTYRHDHKCIIMPLVRLQPKRRN
jgi:alkylation response protein AidB-like acyl-CoA dehydrogenase